MTAHPHGVAAAYDELLKNAPGGSSRAKLSVRGARTGGGGVFSQFVVNEAPQQVFCTGSVAVILSHAPSCTHALCSLAQVAPKEEEAPPPQKPKQKRLITRIDKL